MAGQHARTDLLLAPDSFKGSFSAPEVAAALARGVRAAGLVATELPVADGGEGTSEVLERPLQLERTTARVTDRLGRPLEAAYGLGDGLAVVETAAASGLMLVAPQERDAIRASTYGTGQLIADAVSRGAKTVYVAVGGSATTDGGTGAVRAILDHGGLDGTKLVVLCDVRTPFQDAAQVYGPQKGATPEDVERLTARLNEQAAQYAGRDGRDPRQELMTGAAGGLAGGLWAAFGAELVSGAKFVLEALDFDQRVRAARAVVTGEGRLDHQSLAGKLVSEVAGRARQAGTPCHVVVGSDALPAAERPALGVGLVLEAGTCEELEDAGRQLAESLLVDRPAH